MHWTRKIIMKKCKHPDRATLKCSDKQVKWNKDHVAYICRSTVACPFREGEVYGR
jgi:hypothetical protein